MINLIMVFADNTWDKSPAFIERDRCLTEYILAEYKKQYSDFSKESIEKLKKYLVYLHTKNHYKKMLQLERLQILRYNRLMFVLIMC